MQQAVIEEFLKNIKDPAHRVYKAACRSHSQGEIEMHAYAMRLGIEHNIDPRVFVYAEVSERCKTLNKD